MIYKIKEIIEKRRAKKGIGITGDPEIDKIIEEKIKEATERQYFKPRDLRECVKVIPRLEEAVKRFKAALGDADLTTAYDCTWHTAWEAGRHTPFGDAWTAAYTTVNSIVTNAAVEAAKDFVWNSGIPVALKLAEYASRYIACDVALEVLLKDIYEKRGISIDKHPIRIFVEILDMGVYPRGKYVVDFPIKLEYESPLCGKRHISILGCWKEGDGRIVRAHEWHEECYQAREIGYYLSSHPTLVKMYSDLYPELYKRN